MDAEDEVDDLLKGARRRGGPCMTCKHPKVARINELARAFAGRRAAGETTSWRMFVKLLRVPYEYDHHVGTMLRHVENCLGLDPS